MCVCVEPLLFDCEPLSVIVNLLQWLCIPVNSIVQFWQTNCEFTQFDYEHDCKVIELIVICVVNLVVIDSESDCVFWSAYTHTHVQDVDTISRSRRLCDHFRTSMHA